MDVMKRQNKTPIVEAIIKYVQKDPISFHVPGHKNGKITSEYFLKEVFPFDVTELEGLDDLHHPEGVIKEAQEIAAEFFGADHTFFLVGGSTVGNLAMILSLCLEGDEIIVQRNSHKSVLHGLELAGAKPIFINPEYDKDVFRFGHPSYNELEKAILGHPKAKAIMLTYPDYFGRTYDLQPMVDLAHKHGMIVCVDEAHGVHFSTGAAFPMPALRYGADMVVQSAHKMAPALTMGAYLHIQTQRINLERLKHVLQIVQSSSPSYLILASLDEARKYLANYNDENVMGIVQEIRSLFQSYKLWKVLPFEAKKDDPLKITLHLEEYDPKEIKMLMEEQGIYLEMATPHQLLLILGLERYFDIKKLENKLNLTEKLAGMLPVHDKIEQVLVSSFPHSEFPYSFGDLKRLVWEERIWKDAIGEISGESIVPYPPGIPILFKGEKITEDHIRQIHELLERGVGFQNDRISIQRGIKVIKKGE
ncbi:aminotransferase class I/II-fold pyridoxal phosphate-dependent enzyme [Bacillaceae bacterium S4-13-56]